MSYTIQPEELSSLASEWAALEERCRNDSIFLTPAWRRAWTIADDSEDEGLAPLAIRVDGELRGVALLRQQGGEVTFSGDPNVMDYQDILVSPEEEEPIWHALLDYLDGVGWQSLDLTGIRRHSPTLTYLPTLAEKRGWRVETDLWDVSPGILLPESWEEYLRLLRRKDRHELRRKFRRLEGAAAVSYRVVDGRNDSLAQSLDVFLELMRMSREEKALFLTGERERFFNTLVETMSEAGHLRLCYLDLDGVPVAATLCFDYRDRFFLYNSGYDPAYSSLSVGLLLKAWCIGYAIEQGKRCFDFLRGNEPYKYHLGGKDREIYHCLVRR